MRLVCCIRFVVITYTFVKSLELSELGDVYLIINQTEIGHIPQLDVINIPTYTIHDQFICIEFGTLIISIFIGIYNIFNTIEQNDIKYVISYCGSSILNTLIYQLIYLIILLPILLFYKYSIILLNWIEPNFISDSTTKSNLFIIYPYLMIGIFVTKYYVDLIYIIEMVQIEYNINMSIKPMIWGLCSMGFITYYLHIL